MKIFGMLLMLVVLCGCITITIEQPEEPIESGITVNDLAKAMSVLNERTTKIENFLKAKANKNNE